MPAAPRTDSFAGLRERDSHNFGAQGRKDPHAGLREKNRFWDDLISFFLPVLLKTSGESNKRDTLEICSGTIKTDATKRQSLKGMTLARHREPREPTFQLGTAGSPK